MDVFLIPAGGSRYELYCEVGEEPAPPRQEGRGGWRQRMFDRFTSLVSSVEAARHGAAHRRATGQPRTMVRRIRDRAICWLAEKIAEQRLLWHLQGQRDVTAWYADDMTEREASERVTAMLRADADRHTRWLVIDALGLAGSLALIPIPGPNFLLYYFTFRVVGHYLSRRGARHGLAEVDWQMQATPALTELRSAASLEPEQRGPRVADIASRLRLKHLSAFFDRVAVPSS